MNLNKSTRYALHAALELTRAEGRPVTAAQVAARYAIPENVVAKVLQQLVRAGVASASRGVGGGYRLARPAPAVSVQDVIDLFERQTAPDTCTRGISSAGAPPGESEPTCPLEALFREVDETVRATLASVSLATLAS